MVSKYNSSYEYEEHVYGYFKIQLQNLAMQMTVVAKQPWYISCCLFNFFEEDIEKSSPRTPPHRMMIKIYEAEVKRSKNYIMNSKDEYDAYNYV